MSFRLTDHCRRFLFLFLSFSLYLTFVPKIYAYTEDFNWIFSNPNDWASTSASGTVSFSDRQIILTNSTATNSFPYVRTTRDVFSGLESFTLRVDFNYLSSGNFGDGIAIAPNIPPIGTILGLDHKRYILFLVWRDAPRGTQLYTTACPISNSFCDRRLTQIQTQRLFDFNNHLLKLKMDSDGTYHLFLDSESDEIFVSAPGQVRPSGIWFGSPEQTSTMDYWNSLAIDELTIESESDLALNPVIILPGLGASWDFPAILTGKSGTNWKIPTFVKLYDNLINSLINAGYEKDKNLFVFGYDWRKDLPSLAVNLKSYINRLVSSGKILSTDKIDFVGHSYGGLVARTYAQQFGLAKVDKIITAGSPHQGSLDSYSLWEGATLRGNVWWQRAALELMTRLNQKPGENRVETIRRLAPGVKNVLPVFDFLKRDGSVVAWNSLIQQNPVLTNSTEALKPVLWANGGIGRETDRFLKITDRDWKDRVLGLWEDGKPIGDSQFETSDGDGSVLMTSAVTDFPNQLNWQADHEEIIGGQDALSNIFGQLGLDKTKIVTSNIDKRDKVFVAALRSPGVLQVCNASNVCNSNLGVYLSGQKLFFLPGYNDEPLTVKIKASGSTGEYHLHLGDLSDAGASWDSTSGNLLSGTQVDTYQSVTEADELTIKRSVTLLTRAITTDTNNLNNLLPDWDSSNLLPVALSNQGADVRLGAIRQLHQLLSDLVVQAYKDQKNNLIEAMIPVWVDLDLLAENIVGDGNSTNTAYLDANIAAVESYKTLADTWLKDSSSYYAGVFYDLFDNLFNRAKDVRSTKTDLSLERTFSARYLLLTAMGLK